MGSALAAVGQRLGRRARNWARRRQGTDPATLTLDTRRIYILPTRAGVIFALIVFTMLLGAMNYNNNMGFALAFLLTGIGLVSLYHCHHNLAGLTITATGAAPAFAGEALQFQFALDNPGALARTQLCLGWDGEAPVLADLEPGARRRVVLPLATRRRGPLAAPRLQLSTRYPLGLCRAWSWVHMDLAGLVYPHPETADGEAGDAGEDQPAAGAQAAGEDDFAGLRAWRAGDPPRRIAWKVLARSGQKLVSEYQGGVAQPVWIDWSRQPAPDYETRISRLAWRVLQADAGGGDYGLRLPGLSLPPDRGPAHRHRCLEALARLPGAGTA